MKIGFLHSIIREDEKMLIKTAQTMDIDLVRIDVRKTIFDFSAPLPEDIQSCDIILERSISHSKGLYAVKALEGKGKKVINSSQLIELCGDKISTSIELEKRNIPTVKTVLALSIESALDAIEQMGYPVVIKPAIGSWGRLLAKINDRDSAEAILEHKATLGGYQHQLFYIQEYVEKPGRDIRVVVIGEESVAAMYRNADHWITNSARGGNPANCPITDEIKSIVKQITDAMGPGLMGIDFFETKEGLKVVEVNAGVEFKSVSQVNDTSIPQKIWEYVLKETTT